MLGHLVIDWSKSISAVAPCGKIVPSIHGPKKCFHGSERRQEEEIAKNNHQQAGRSKAQAKRGHNPKHIVADHDDDLFSGDYAPRLPSAILYPISSTENKRLASLRQEEFCHFLAWK
jgi:hypothetical protein